MKLPTRLGKKFRLIGCFFALASAALVSAPGASKATIITAGQTLSPVPSEALPTGTYVAAESESFNGTIGSDVVFSGTLFSGVINVGSVSNPDYDFMYQVTNNSGSEDPIARLSLADFTGFATDVSYSTTSAFTGPGNTAPSDATESSGAGSIVGFDFNPNQISPGSTTYTLIVATDAKSYVQGDGSVTDDGVGNAEVVVPTYGVMSGVPEPGSVALIAVAGGLVLSRRRRVG